MYFGLAAPGCMIGCFHSPRKPNTPHTLTCFWPQLPLEFLEWRDPGLELEEALCNPHTDGCRSSISAGRLGRADNRAGLALRSWGFRLPTHGAGAAIGLLLFLLPTKATAQDFCDQPNRLWETEPCNVKPQNQTGPGSNPTLHKGDNA